ncbi:MAG: hypothetical protein NT077_04560 [Candidatus Taylorbacteria bacterium]|nr:hypothetical protein [Candidatus Taylorbacteria bacterium]
MKDNTRNGRMRIVKTPSGQVPVAIRNEWIGVEMPFLEVGIPRGSVVGVVNGKKVKPAQCFIVDQQEALNALRKKTPAAADWWNRMGFPWPLGQFTFNAECAEII